VPRCGSDECSRVGSGRRSGLSGSSIGGSDAGRGSGVAMSASTELVSPEEPELSSGETGGRKKCGSWSAGRVCASGAGVGRSAGTLVGGSTASPAAGVRLSAPAMAGGRAGTGETGRSLTARDTGPTRGVAGGVGCGVGFTTTTRGKAVFAPGAERRLPGADSRVIVGGSRGAAALSGDETRMGEMMGTAGGLVCRPSGSAVWSVIE
jgi:hypothetical protein